MPQVAEAERRLRPRELFPFRSKRVSIALLVFTAFYFADVCLRASAKHFWYDELLTLYFARLPNLHSVWGALQTGIDSNPPGFDLLTRAVRAIFGEGPIAMRLPEIVAFWVMCLCLFRFVERRAGTLAGFIAMTLPMLTGAYYYAYEARPLILVAACAALALLCWDNALELQRGNRWLVGFTLALFAALMLHCYAILLVIPFGVTELVRTLHNRRVNGPFWIAIVAPVLPACALYIPLARIFSAFSKGTEFAFVNRAVWSHVLEFYGFLILPCSAIILAALALFAFDKNYASSAGPVDDRVRFTWRDLLLSLSFLALPAFGAIVARIVHTPYFSRYFLSAILGMCIAFAIAAGNRQLWISRLLMVLIICSMALNFARIVRHRLNGTGDKVVEPSTQMVLETTPGDPLHLHPLIRSFPSNSVPIAVLNPLEFLYVLQYAPDLASRIYYVHGTDRDSSFRGLRDFRRWSPVQYNPPATAQSFVDSHPKFYVYCDRDEMGNVNSLARLASINSLRVTEDHFLVQMESGPASSGGTKR